MWFHVGCFIPRWCPILTRSVAYMPPQGWGESVLPGLRGTAWKEKVASTERMVQGVLSGEVERGACHQNG